MGKFRERTMRWMAGRNGADLIYRTLVCVCLVLVLLNLLLQSWVVSLLTFLLAGYAIFRCLSRNVWKRREEDRKFRQFFGRISGFFRLKRNQLRDRKTNVYRRCPSCRNMLRLPRRPGEHTVNCPCCHTRFALKIGGRRSKG
jgi:LSD1 subclass zinc finger protein